MAEENIDQIAAVKAGLEMMVSENNEVHEYFRDLLKKLDDLEGIDASDRHAQFRELEEGGAFSFQGIDIRHFARSVTKQPLPPKLFVNRTKRRLKNTNSLVNQFISRGTFDAGSELRDEIDKLTFSIVNESDIENVKEFRARVEELRNSELFTQYTEAKTVFVKQDAEIRSEAQFLATKESLEDGEEMVRERGEKLEEVGEKLESGDFSADEAQEQLEELALDSEEPGLELED